MSDVTEAEAPARAERRDCGVCGESAADIGPVRSKTSGHTFHLRRCDACGFGFVADPRVDFATLYDEAYYRGRGADPLVDYVAEMGDARTVREYEWRGVTEIVRGLSGMRSPRWLDFGCGLGGLVRHARREGIEADGFDEGFGVGHARALGLPVLGADELGARAGSYDVVTAIEVLEHVLDPVDTLRTVAELLKPGGVLFVTTGNAAPHSGDLTRWNYVIPDVHVSFYEPRTLARLYAEAGLEAVPVGWSAGFADVVRYKVLKNLRVSRRGRLESLVPWTMVGRLVDRRYGFSAQPAARRR